MYSQTPQQEHVECDTHTMQARPTCTVIPLTINSAAMYDDNGYDMSMKQPT